MDEIFVDVVIYKNGEHWVAQGLQLDILVYAAEPNTLPQMFVQALNAEVARATKHGQKPFARIPPAEKRYFEMFKASTITVLVEEPLHVRMATPQNLPPEKFATRQ